MPTVPAHPYRDHWLFSGVLHRGARRVAWVLQLARVLTIWWPFGVLQQISQRERGSIFVASMATLLVTSGLKQWNTTSCPWDLVDFGGPARAAWICFATALLAGITVGLAQQIRGAHYLSHTLWTAWLCWFVTLACYGFLTRDRGGPGSQHADGHNLNIVLTVKAHIHGVTPFAPAMSHVDIPLFLWINASSASPAWLLALARFASQELVQWLIAATVGALVVGDAQVRRCVLQVAIAMVIAWIGARLIQHLLPMPRPFALGLGTPW